MRKILFILLNTLSIAAQGLWIVDANASFNRFADRHNQTVINTYTLTSPPQVEDRIGLHLPAGLTANLRHIEPHPAFSHHKQTPKPF